MMDRVALSKCAAIAARMFTLRRYGETAIYQDQEVQECAESWLARELADMQYDLEAAKKEIAAGQGDCFTMLSENVVAFSIPLRLADDKGEKGYA